MPKKKKEEPVVMTETFGQIKTAIVNFGSIVMELSFDKRAGKCFGTIFEDGHAKRFEAEVK